MLTIRVEELAKDREFNLELRLLAGDKGLQSEIEYYLSHDRVRQEMAEEARKRVQRCTFEDRAREILIPAIEEVL